MTRLTVIALACMAVAVQAGFLGQWYATPRASQSAPATTEYPVGTAFYCDFSVQAEVTAGFARNEIGANGHATQATATAKAGWGTAVGGNGYAIFNGVSTCFSNMGGRTPLTNPWTNAGGCTILFWANFATNAPAGVKQCFYSSTMSATKVTTIGTYDDRSWIAYTGESTLIPSILPSSQCFQWKCVAVRIGPDTFDLWINSTNVATGDGAVSWTPYGALDNPYGWSIGGNGGLYMTGALDKVCIVTGLLTTTQITNFMLGTKSQFWP